MFMFDRLLVGPLAKKARAHQGEDCYIFGDGPSVKWFDLKSFRDKPAICCNMFPFHKYFRELDVRYCTITEPRYFAPLFLKRGRANLVGTHAISRDYRKLIAQNPRIGFLVHISNYPFIRGSNVSFEAGRLPGSGGLIRELNRFVVFGGAFYATLGLAYFLGFARVYLIGFDAWVIQPSRLRHWYEFGEGERFEATNFGEDFLGILKREMQIYAISASGGSRNAIHIDYRAHTGRTAVYRENFDLADERALAVLATYPGYQIFKR